MYCTIELKPLNAELNPICHLLALLQTHHILHVSSISVKVLDFLLIFKPKNVRSFRAVHYLF